MLDFCNAAFSLEIEFRRYTKAYEKKNIHLTGVKVFTCWKSLRLFFSVCYVQKFRNLINSSKKNKILKANSLLRDLLELFLKQLGKNDDVISFVDSRLRLFLLI